jgi:hypothetical protein
VPPPSVRPTALSLREREQLLAERHIAAPFVSVGRTQAVDRSDVYCLASHPGRPRPKYPWHAREPRPHHYRAERCVRIRAGKTLTPGTIRSIHGVLVKAFLTRRTPPAKR